MNGGRGRGRRSGSGWFADYGRVKERGTRRSKSLFKDITDKRVPLCILTQKLLSLCASEDSLRCGLQKTSQVGDDGTFKIVRLERLCDDVWELRTDDQDVEKFVGSGREDETNDVQKDRMKDVVMIIQDHEIQTNRKQITG